MKRNYFSFLASLNAVILSISIFSFTSFPSLQLASNSKAESVSTEYGKNFPWTVDKGESISEIAAIWYGDASFASTLWNDNPWIADPSVLEAGWVLEVRSIKPILPTPLKPDLVAKQKYLQPGTYLQIQPVRLAQPELINTPVVQVASYSGGSLNEAQIQFLGTCESGMTASRNSGNGYYGAFQFSPATWRNMGTAYERADMAPIEVQKEAVQRLLSRSSIFTQFPGCARKMRSLGMI